jgi:predicted 2-oxoglutarate/Fe(II)-dependent dioxygenase YbiX
MSRFIFTVDDALTGLQCREIIARFDGDSERFAGFTGYGIAPRQKTSYDADISGRPEWLDIENALRLSLKAGVAHYTSVNDSFSSLERVGCAAFRLRCYDIGHFFEWHIDNFAASVATRVLACIWYLNDVARGGATEFLYQDLRFQPRAGQLLLFPTGFEYVHRSTPVESNPKYVAVGFVEHLEGHGREETDAPPVG